MKKRKYDGIIVQSISLFRDSRVIVDKRLIAKITEYTRNPDTRENALPSIKN